jgi:hypothetical protein
MEFWILTCSPDWLCTAKIRLSFRGRRWTFWGLEFRCKSNIERSRNFDITHLFRSILCDFDKSDDIVITHLSRNIWGNFDIRHLFR